MRKQENNDKALAPATTLGAREEQSETLRPDPDRMEFALRALSDQCTRPSLTEPKARREWTGKIWCAYVKHLCDDALRATLTPSPSPQPQVAEGKEEKMIAEMKAMNDQWAAIHELLHTLPDDDWDEAPFVAIRELQNKQAGWIKTAERPPNETDGDARGRILVADDKGFTQSRKVGTVLMYGAVTYPFWMPIPPVEGQQKDLGER